jgi:hypothetical protein
MNMIMRALIASLALVVVGCDVAQVSVVETRCDASSQYFIVKEGDGDYRLQLTVGPLINPHGCTNGLTGRHHASTVKISSKSLDEVHRIIQSEVRRRQVRISELPQLPTGQR